MWPRVTCFECAHREDPFNTLCQLSAFNRIISHFKFNIVTVCFSRSSPEVKRSICKRCSGLLVPGATATHSFVSAGQPRFEVCCRNCGFVRRYLMPRSASPAPVNKHGAQAAAVSQQATEQASTLPASGGSPISVSVTAATVEATAAASERETESMVDSR